MTSRRFHRLFGGPPRRPQSRLQQRHADLAASVQAVAEEALLRMSRHVQRATGLKHLVLAGGVALNCVANGRLLRDGPFAHLWIQPAAGDAGGALGAALFTWHQLLGHAREPRGGDLQHGSLLGPAFSRDQIACFLREVGADGQEYSDQESLLAAVAELLDEGLVVGWFDGRMEFGPRALGARSILADPRRPDMHARLNLSIKFRETFRPFAPIVLAEYAAEYFDLPRGADSPYMLLVAPVSRRQRVPLPEESLRQVPHDEDLGRRLHFVRSTIPAVTHVDYSARIQTVDRSRHPRLHRLLECFHARTGCPVLVNTSFNVRGEPIVCTPRDAYRCFQATAMDALVLGDFILRKPHVPADAQDRCREPYLQQFQLD